MAVGLVLLVGCVALLGNAADEVSENIEEEQEERDRDAMADVELVDCRTDPTTGWAEAEVEVTNNSSERSNYSIDVVFVSPDGSEQYGSAGAFVNGLAPGQSKTEVAGSLDEAPEGFECEITDVFRMSDE